MGVVQTFIFDKQGRNLGSFSSAEQVAFQQPFAQLKAYVSKHSAVTDLTSLQDANNNVLLTLNGKTYLSAIRRIQANDELYIVDVFDH